MPLGRDQFYIDVRYTNLRPIGGGSYGVVCSADDTATGRRVAIKKIANVFSDLVDAKRARGVRSAAREPERRRPSVRPSVRPGARGASGGSRESGIGCLRRGIVLARDRGLVGGSCGKSSCCGISGATRISCRSSSGAGRAGDSTCSSPCESVATQISRSLEPPPHLVRERAKRDALGATRGAPSSRGRRRWLALADADGSPLPTPHGGPPRPVLLRPCR